MTHAIMRDECWPAKADNNDDTCNICGLYFTFDRGLFMAGNMWTATCGYIQQLIEPRYFEANMTAIVKDAWLQSVVTGNLAFAQYPQEPPYLGIDRYADEWWIGSHPTVNPCDYSGTIPRGMDYDRTKQFLTMVCNTNSTRMSSRWTFVSGSSFPGQRYKLPKGMHYNREKLKGDDPNYWKKEYS